MDNLFCTITGRTVMNMRLKIFLRVANALIIIAIFKFSNVDWVIVYGLIVVIADLDAIADAINKKREQEC